VSIGRDADSLDVIKDANTDIEIEDGEILKVGKKRFFRLKTE